MQTQDRRRFNGPELLPFERLQSDAVDLFKPDHTRSDGRRAEDPRPIFLNTGLIPQASGSAYIETGQHKIVCAVYGPHPGRRDTPFSPKATLNVEVKYAPFATRNRKTPGKDTESSTLSFKLAQALLPALRLDLLPKSAIDLNVLILETDAPESDISAGVTASSVALADAGVEMFGLIIGSCATTLDGSLLVDPTYQESAHPQTQGLLSIACLPAMGTVTNLSFQGDLPKDSVKEALSLLKSKCDAIHGVAVKALSSSVKTQNVGEDSR